MSQEEFPGMPESIPEGELCQASWDRVSGCPYRLEKAAMVKLIHEVWPALSDARVKSFPLTAICDSVPVLSCFGMNHNDRDAYLALAGLSPFPEGKDGCNHRPLSEKEFSPVLERMRSLFAARLIRAGRKLQRGAQKTEEPRKSVTEPEPDHPAMEELVAKAAELGRNRGAGSEDE